MFDVVSERREVHKSSKNSYFVAHPHTFEFKDIVHEYFTRPHFKNIS